MNMDSLRSIFKMSRPNKLKDVSGKIVLITRAGYSMEREIAIRFAELGAVIVGVDNPKGDEEPLKIIENSGGKAHRYECDVTDRAAVFNLAEKVMKEVGEVSILVNIVHIMARKPLLHCTEQMVRSTIDANLAASIWMIQAFLPGMKERNHGHVVAISSIADLIGFKDLVPYYGSWYAVRVVMKALENELLDESEGNSQIKFTTISPYMENMGTCKDPSSSYDGLMMVEVGEAADFIIDAVRRDIRDTSISSSMLSYIGT